MNNVPQTNGSTMEYCWQHGNVSELPHDPHGPGNGYPWTETELFAAHTNDVIAEYRHWYGETGDYAHAMLAVLRRVRPSADPGHHRKVQP